MDELRRWAEAPGWVGARQSGLAAHLIGTVLPNLPRSQQLSIKARALKKRIEAVQLSKREQGDTGWSWDPSRPIDQNDHIVDALLGPGSFHLYLDSCIVEEVMHIALTEENFDRVERFFGYDSVGALAEDIRNGQVF